MTFHPVQTYPPLKYAPEAVTRRAYEVYCTLWGPQEALVTGWCRGGFGQCELMALLYAHSFQATEWRQRYDEAIQQKPADISDRGGR